MLSNSNSPSKASTLTSRATHRGAASLPDDNARELLERLKEILDTSPHRLCENNRAIRLPEVLHLLGISKSSWYERLNRNSANYDPSAPKPFKLGSSVRSPSVWWHSEIQAYLSMRASASRSASEVRS
ncbi:TPA: helix-turn-helix transcriptional regulator [Stenotrophomonas maltophilia]|uniref:helix-turn-helix transcriptional regulator n=1 Tax=Stenotrophomonas maltophilia TaxID=40324 RepID=UPI0013DA61D4|nr:AlpA family phage regulatory protein [Stenotrophomonas maltophilia]MBH1612177.1 AlpA family phage regulatory protein [Stenotrophomonas maltophilia]MBH1715909.1 AlpA family phage regulatory protein [Stenotrophomonas maltophilia]MBN5166977.1 AlpA family phage regulatory protein [Stenotrophomonas maltophilia]HEL3236776.1 AlpA family phage regulatory protein [Stenotrophomonas maltophilia]